MNYAIPVSTIALFLLMATIYPDVKGTDGNPVKIIAHRGAWKKNNLPQNSVSSLKQAISLNLNGSEFDVQMTSDDSIVLNHDREYNKLNIEKTTFNELVRYPLANGENLPTLREYLAAGMENNLKTRLICEIKPSGISRERAVEIAEKTVTLVNRMNAKHLVSYISFDYNVVKRISELDPEADVQYLNGDKSPSELKADGINGLDYNISVFRKRPEWITEAKNAGMVLNAWTVNKPDDMDWLIDLGFDYITTDEPELLAEKIRLR